MTGLAEYLSFWRTTVARDREIVEAVVRPEHRGPSPALAAALDHWPGVYYWGSRGDADRLVLIRALAAPARERWWLHVTLFLATFVAVWMGGALLSDVDTRRLPSLHGPLSEVGLGLLHWVGDSAVGVPFAMALMAILFAHEMGHYVTARRYGINASPPFFLPAPWEVNFIGTFGAFIRLRSPVVDRRQLMDVGAAGPWAGFAIALLMLVVGLKYSIVFPGSPAGDHMVIEVLDLQVVLGDSLLTWGLRHTMFGETGLILHDLAFAGWVGLLVTTLNLLPLGQLDGGHILYALLARAQRSIGWLTWFGLVALGFWQWWWWVWAGLILLLGGGRLGHPQVLEQHRPLPLSRIPVGVASIVLFLVTFTPVPILV